MSATTFRVLSYNVNSLRSDAAAATRVIRAAAADIACIQESPRSLRWRTKCADLARRSGMWVVAGGYPAGLLVLGGLRTKVLHTESFWLSFVPRYLQRGLTLAVLEIGGARVAVANMHLDLYPEGRMRHADEILTHLARVRREHDAPVVLVGDVNEEPGEPVWQRFAHRFQDAYAVAPRGGEWTFSARRPRTRIDAIFADADVRVLGCGVPDVADIEVASDHCPLTADLELPA